MTATATGPKGRIAPMANMTIATMMVETVDARSAFTASEPKRAPLPIHWPRKRPTAIETVMTSRDHGGHARRL